MPDYFSKGIKTDLIKLGVYQIIGGLIGIAFIIRSVFTEIAFNEVVFLFYLIFFLFFGYSILCGWLCVRCNRNALLLSLINQFLQLVSISIAGFSFSYAAGFYLVTGVDFTESFKINFDAGLSNLHLFLNNQSNTILFNFNWIAFYLIYWIERLRKQVKLEDDIKESDSIGEDQFTKPASTINSINQ
jgi:hypothetical protein